MNILGFKLEEELRNELEKNIDFDNNFVENIDSLLKVIKTKKFDAILIDEEKFQIEVLINLVGKIFELQKKSIISIIGKTSNLKLVAGCIKAGAHDYHLQPISPKEILDKTVQAVKAHKLLAERVEKQKSTGDKLIGNSKEIVEVYKKIGRVSKSMLPVLIVGEKGIGKTSVAKAIHEFSQNKDKPFVSLNCNVMGAALLERKLFGYEKGAFAGALTSQIGEIEKLNNGTLHIGNIHAMDIEMQSKLLYFLDNREVYKLGSVVPFKSNVRIIVSTTENLEALTKTNKFIAELYSKLRVLEVYVPPLRERKDDIPYIIDHYIEKCGEELGIPVKGISKPALKKLLRYDWPENTRELKNAIKSAIAITSSETLLLDDLPSNILGTGTVKSEFCDQELALKIWMRQELASVNLAEQNNYYEEVISKIERELISQILEKTNGKKVEASEILGITRNTLRTKMSKYHLE